MRALLLLALLLSTTTFAQKPAIKYVQLEARVDWYGDVQPVSKVVPKVGKKDLPDPVLNIDSLQKRIDADFDNKHHPITFINELAGEGWTLVAVSFVPGADLKDIFSDKGRMVYILKKEAGIQK
jgi:hypothetical protein